jgi:enterochelin esterase-like enzyme
VAHGTVQAVWYPSPTLKLASRRMMVYTPPGYEQAARSIPSCTCCTAAAATKMRG